jgi:endonuclease YncB( thermonuclease family)
LAFPEIIRQGYAFAYTRFPFKYIEEFRGYEREARENESGLWADRNPILPWQWQRIENCCGRSQRK